MLYRLYIPADFSALYAVEELCFAPAFRFSRSYMRQLIESPDSVTWIAEENAELIAFSIVEWTEEQSKPAAYIQTIEVHPEFRGCRIGTELLSRAESSARAAGAHMITLHVDVENAAAIHLYESRGYAREGREEHYYARHRAAFVYARPLSSPVE
jgi:ribosomal protein S18 acetylase RimI-like enzyme